MAWELEYHSESLCGPRAREPGDCTVMLPCHPGFRDAGDQGGRQMWLWHFHFVNVLKMACLVDNFNFQKPGKSPPSLKRHAVFSPFRCFTSHLIKIGVYYSKCSHELLHYMFRQCLNVNNSWKLCLVLILNQFSLGHVDAGKSTLMGHMLYLLGNVNKRIMHKYEQESKKAGKASFAYAWVLDETGEERER